MTPTLFPRNALAMSLLAALTLLGTASASAAPPSRCPWGPARDGTSNCMSKAEYTLTQGRQNALDADPGQYQRNGLQRCEALKGDDRQDCETRIKGGGSVSGSVDGGGLYRELVTVVPGKPAEPAAVVDLPDTMKRPSMSPMPAMPGK